MPRILVAVDESEASRRAAEFIDRFFARMDAHITAVNVAQAPPDTMPATPFGGMYPWRDAVAREREAMAEAMEREEQAGEAVAAAQAPADADIEVVFGKVVDAITLAAEDDNADLIVVGSSDKGFLQRLLHGSVSEELARKTPRPLLIVP